MAAHFAINASPPINSKMKAIALMTIMSKVTTGKCLGVREASDNGITVGITVKLDYCNAYAEFKLGGAR